MPQDAKGNLVRRWIQRQLNFGKVCLRKWYCTNTFFSICVLICLSKRLCAKLFKVKSDEKWSFWNNIPFICYISFSISWSFEYCIIVVFVLFCQDSTPVVLTLSILWTSEIGQLWSMLLYVCLIFWLYTELEVARESAYLCQVEWFKHYYYYYYSYHTYHKERGGRRKSRFAVEGGKSNSRRCCLGCWCNDVIAIMSHHVHRRNDRTMDRTANLLISSNVHYAHLGGDN